MASRKRKNRILQETDLFTVTGGSEAQQLLCTFKDAWQSSAHRKAGKHAFRGRCNARWGNTLYRFLNAYHIPTHWVAAADDLSMVVLESETQPFSARIWNFSSEELASRIGIPENEMLRTPVLEWYLEKTPGETVLVGPDHLFALQLTDAVEIRKLDQIVHKTNAVLKSYLERRGLKLFDMQLNFGRDGHEELMISGGLTPESMGLADIELSTLKKVKRVDVKKEKKAYEILFEQLSE